jgi:hypothetical protein
MNEISDIEVEVPGVEEGDNFDKFNLLKEQLLERCKKANIAYHEEKLEPEDFWPAITISLPCGRDKRDVYVTEFSDLQTLLAIEFEKYGFIGDYAAISRQDKQFVEAAIRPVGGLMRGGRFFRLIEERIREGTETRISINPLSLEGIINGVSIKATIGPPSTEFSILTNIRGPRIFSLRLEGLPSMYHDTIMSFLERFSDTIFFQIDSLFETPLALIRQRPNIRRARRGNSGESKLIFPELEYDQAPMSLYFYGRGATGLPLVQFLAFYQVLEFYFPVCFQAEARRRIRTTIKDPSFRLDRDSDITRIISTVQAGATGGYADERAMLRATLQETIDAADLRRFLEEDEHAAEFYKSKTKGLTDHKIPLENKQIDLRQDVSDRMYDIRCKIVHTKASGRDGSYELLLPYSKEAGMLSYDIDLVHYVARKVLIYASSPLQIGV